MISVVRRILKLGSPMLTLFLSTTGCFVFMEGCGLVATGIRNVGHGGIYSHRRMFREPSAGTRNDSTGDMTREFPE
jgi:hypothetical protein